MMTKTEITPRQRAGVAVLLVPTAFSGPAGYRHAASPAGGSAAAIG
ncbi:hypothetical protein [Humibacter sp.]|jgi:hypothetical protein